MNTSRARNDRRTRNNNYGSEKTKLNAVPLSTRVGQGKRISMKHRAPKHNPDDIKTTSTPGSTTPALTQKYRTTFGPIPSERTHQDEGTLAAVVAADAEVGHEYLEPSSKPWQPNVSRMRVLVTKYKGRSPVSSTPLKATLKVARRFSGVRPDLDGRRGGEDGRREGQEEGRRGGPVNG